MRVFVLLAMVFGGACYAADGPPIAFTRAQIIPIDSDPLPSGTIVVQGRQIVGIGADGEVTIPRGAIVHDMNGRVVMPGLVCTHSHIGGSYAADGSGPVQPGVRVLDSLNVRDSGFKRALAGGLTTLNIMPGSGHLSSGQTIYVKLRFFDERPSTIEQIF